LASPGLDPKIKEMCLRQLKEAAQDLPIIYMEQDPSWPICGMSMYKQIQAGLDQVETKFVAIAEHDCLYSSEHFAFVPPDDHFWYNQNNWLLQYHNPNHPEMDGTFSYWPKRRVQSQLICNRDLFKEATSLAMTICEDPLWNEVRHNMGVGEPGAVDYDKAMRLTRGSRKQQLRNRVKDYIVGYNARDFWTEVPNVDIRHTSNFTGPRRGRKKRMELEPWGTIDNLVVK